MKNAATGLWDLVMGPVQNMIQVIMTYLPNILGAIIILVIGKIVTGLIGGALRKAMDKVGTENLIDKMGIKETTGIQTNFTSLFVRVVKFIVSWGFLTAAVAMLNIEVLTNGLEAIIGYLPRIFAACILVFLGYVGAKFVKNVIMEFGKASGMSIAGNLAKAAEVLIMLFAVTTGLDWLYNIPKRSLLSILLACVAMGATFTLTHSHMWFILSGLCGVLVYFGLLFLICPSLSPINLKKALK